MRRLLALVAAVGITLVASGCSQGSSSGATHTGAVNARLFFAPATLDPQAFNDIASRALAAYAYDTPVGFRNGKIVPELASRWEVTTTSLTMWIRSDVTCSDGSKLTATEVADSITRMVNPATGDSFVLSAFGQTHGITAVANLSDNSVAVQVPQPFGDLLYGETKDYIVCRAGLDDPAQLKTKTLGSGQYVLDEFVTGDHYTYAKRSGYKWGPAGVNNSGGQWPTKITFKVIESETTATNLFLSSGLDLTVAQGPDTARLNSSSLATTKKTATVDIYTMSFNHNTGRPTEDVNIRRMLWAGLNRPDFAQAIAPGGQPPQTWVDPGGLCYNPSAVSASMIPFSASAAQQYASAAGFQLQNGQLMKNGQQLKLTVIIPNVFGNGAGDFLVSAWGKLGIKVNAVTEPVAQAVQTFVTPGSDWDVFLAGGGDYSPTVMATLALPGPPNFSRVQNAAFDQLESQAAAQPTQTSCALWNSAEEELYKAADILPFMLATATVYGHNLTFTPWLLSAPYPDTLNWT
jgi:peptide/nickel transport system substrate-binding protein